MSGFSQTVAVIEGAYKKNSTTNGRLLDDLPRSVPGATLMAHNKLAEQAQNKRKPVPTVCAIVPCIAILQHPVATYCVPHVCPPHAEENAHLL